MKIKSYFLRPIPFVLLACFSSLAVMAVVFPGLLVFHDRTLMFQHDLANSYENTFSLVSQFYSGGLQLWDRYDQMGIGFSHLAYGLYNVSTLLVAGLYILVAPLVKYPGPAFHALYSVGFFGINTLIRTAGGYLLLRQFIRRPVVIFVALLYLNTILSSMLWMGLMNNNLFSFLPFILFFVVRFFAGYRLNDFLAFVVMMTIAVMNTALLALGYFYHTVHFFLVVNIVCALIYQRPKISAALFLRAFRTSNFLKAALTLVVCGSIIMPAVIFVKNLNSDFYIAGSGLGQTQGRLKDIGSVSAYFKDKGQSLLDQKKLPMAVIDYQHNHWDNSWLFLGGSALMLALLAMVFSRRREKHLFFWTVLLIILVNSPVNPRAWTSLAHWITALTDPTSFLLRSFGMTAMMLPIYLFPLVALGLEAGGDLVAQHKENVYAGRLPLGLSLGIALLCLTVWFVPSPTKSYMIAILLCYLVFLYLSWLAAQERRRPLGIPERALPWLTGFLLAITFVLEIQGLSVYIAGNPYSNRPIVPSRHENLSELPLVVDYQNPHILPLEQFARVSGADITPNVYRDQNFYGKYFHFTPLDRYFKPPDIYRPRHKSYAGLYTDRQIQAYLNKNKKLVFFAGYALSGPGALADIMRRGWEKEVVSVEDPAAGVYGSPEQVTELMNKPREDEALRELREEFGIDQARRRRRGSHVEYDIPLPDRFPGHLATTVFTDDHKDWKLMIDDTELSEAQGYLNEPFTYDVRNVRTDSLTVLLPSDFDVKGKKAVLSIRLDPNLGDILKNTEDKFAFQYKAPADGWLVFHYPHDPKWKAFINGEPAKLYRVNRYFMGMPLSSGQQTVELSYWPDTPLRGLIPLSIIAVFAAFAGLVVYGMKAVDAEGVDKD